MPITYVLDRSRNIIIETWTGTVSAADLAAYWHIYLTDSEVIRCRRTLVDLRHTTILFTGAELAALVHTIVLPELNGKKWVSAFLIEKAAQYGTSRQYQVFAEQYSNDAIFSDWNTAIDWLVQQHP
jgi:hypothetical protein